MKQRAALVVASVALMASMGCAPEIKGYGGPALDHSRLAYVHNVGAFGNDDCAYCLISIKGDDTVYYDKQRDGLVSGVSLMPGTYEITYEEDFAPLHEVHEVSVRRTDKVDLKAGYFYEPAFEYRDGEHHLYLWLVGYDTAARGSVNVTSIGDPPPPR